MVTIMLNSIIKWSSNEISTSTLSTWIK